MMVAWWFAQSKFTAVNMVSVLRFFAIVMKNCNYVLKYSIMLFVKNTEHRLCPFYQKVKCTTIYLMKERMFHGSYKFVSTVYRTEFLVWHGPVPSPLGSLECNAIAFTIMYSKIT